MQISKLLDNDRLSLDCKQYQNNLETGSLSFDNNELYDQKKKLVYSDITKYFLQNMQKDGSTRNYLTMGRNLFKSPNLNKTMGRNHFKPPKKYLIDD